MRDKIYFLLCFVVVGIGLAFFITNYAFSESDNESPKPKMLKVALPGDCATCHGEEQVLPTGHVDTKNMKLAQCVICHKKDTPKNKELLGKGLPPSLQVPECTLEKAIYNLYHKKKVVTNKWVTASLRGRMPLDHTHWLSLSSAMCTFCHETHGTKLEEPEPLTTEKCLSCHGSFQEMAARTASMHFGYNPHDSHYKELDCYVCHYMHSKSENFCAECHEFKFDIIP